ncbi:MAG: hypothetical protein ACRDSM_12425, partial [Pseudonocardiaceae bacterium]
NWTVPAGNGKAGEAATVAWRITAFNTGIGIELFVVIVAFAPGTGVGDGLGDGLGLGLGDGLGLGLGLGDGLGLGLGDGLGLGLGLGSVMV